MWLTAERCGQDSLRKLEPLRANRAAYPPSEARSGVAGVGPRLKRGRFYARFCIGAEAGVYPGNHNLAPACSSLAEDQTCSALEAARARRNENVYKRPCFPIIPYDVVTPEATDIEVTVGPEDQASGCN